MYLLLLISKLISNYDSYNFLIVLINVDVQVYYAESVLVNIYVYEVFIFLHARNPSWRMPGGAAFPSHSLLWLHVLYPSS